MTTRVRTNSVSGVVQEAPLSNAATALAMAGRMQNLATVAAGQVAVLVIDPEGTDVLAGSGTEIVYVTAYTSGGGSATIQRGREGTTGRPHSAGTRIVHSPTNLDFGGSLFGFDTAGNLNVSGNVAGVSNDHYFGAHALGGAGQVLHIQSNSGAGAVILAAESSTATSDLYLQVKGDATFYLQNAGGGTTLGELSSAALRIVPNDFYVGPYALGAGAGVTRGHFLTDATAFYIAAEGDGTDRDLIERIKGAGVFRWQKADATVLAEVGNSGGFAAKGADHYFGPRAFGAASHAVLHISELNTSTMLLKPESDSTNASLTVEVQAGGIFTVDQDGGGTFFGVRPGTDNGDTYSRVAITFNESAVENAYYVRVGAAGTGPGGVGKALYV